MYPCSSMLSLKVLRIFAEWRSVHSEQRDHTMRHVFAYKRLKTIWKTVKLSDQKREFL